MLLESSKSSKHCLLHCRDWESVIVLQNSKNSKFATSGHGRKETAGVSLSGLNEQVSGRLCLDSPFWHSPCSPKISSKCG